MNIGENIHGGTEGQRGDQNKPASLAMGIVKSNWNPLHPGMVQVSILVDGGNESVSDWMPVASPYAANQCGLYLLPEVGSTVIIGYVDDNSVSPVVIGSLWIKQGKSNSALPGNTAASENPVKVFSTSKGQMIKFDESSTSPSIEILSAKKQRVFLDDKNEKIILSSGGSENKITIEGKTGNISIEAKKGVSIKVGGKDAISISSTETTVKSTKMKYDGNVLELKGKQTKVEGTAVEVKSSGNLTLQSSGMAQVKGSMLKLN